ncbi:MAG: hypothetical protein QW184_01350 [Nanopusillaceae archaeon]
MNNMSNVIAEAENINKTKNEIYKLLEEDKLSLIYSKNFKDNDSDIFLEIYKCKACNKFFALIEVEKKDKIKTNLKRLIYEIKMHLSKHNF